MCHLTHFQKFRLFLFTLRLSTLGICDIRINRASLSWIYVICGVRFRILFIHLFAFYTIHMSVILNLFASCIVLKSKCYYICSKNSFVSAVLSNFRLPELMVFDWIGKGVQNSLQPRSPQIWRSNRCLQNFITVIHIRIYFCKMLPLNAGNE